MAFPFLTECNHIAAAFNVPRQTLLPGKPRWVTDGGLRDPASFGDLDHRFLCRHRFFAIRKITSYLSLNVDHGSGDVVLLLDVPQQRPFLSAYGAINRPSQSLVVLVDGLSLGHLQGTELCYDFRAEAIPTRKEIEDGWDPADLSTLLLRELLRPISIAKPADTAGRLGRFVAGFAVPKRVLRAIPYYSREVVTFKDRRRTHVVKDKVSNGCVGVGII